MKLRQIKLAGFKTFVDPTSIKLDGQLAGIVGPNGCGKSNIMESVKWVLGSSSAKEMRGESMDSVIFSGTDTRQAIGRASVELFFDNSEGTAPDEWAKYAEISVKRVIEKEKGSTYYINNTTVRRKDVADLFLGTGLGSHGYAIIGQNTISQIVEAKPEELKSYLEEAAGVSKYKERRKETEFRLRDTRSNLSRIEDVQKEINQQITKLESQAQSAKKHNELQEKLKFIEAQIAFLRKINANEKWKEKHTLVEKKELELEKQTSNLTAIETEVEIARQENIKKTDAVNEYQAQFYEVNAAVTNTENKLNNLNEKIQNLIRLKEGSETKLKEFDLLAKENDAQLQETKKIFKQEKIRFSDESKIIEKLKEEFIEIEEKYNSNNKNWNDANSKWLKLKEQLNVESATIELTEKIILDFNQRKQTFENELNNLNKNSVEIEKPKNLLELEREIKDLIDLIHDNKLSADKLETEKSSAKEHEYTTKEKITETELRINSIKQIISKEFNPEAINDWLDKIDVSNKENIFKHVSVKKGWEKAISILLGNKVHAFYIDDKSYDGIRPPHSVTLINKANFNFEENKTSNSVINLIEKANDFIMPALKEWLSNIYYCEDGKESSQRKLLKKGQILINKSGDIFGDSYQILSEDKNTESNQLAKIKELDNLEDLLPNLINDKNNSEKEHNLIEQKYNEIKSQIDKQTQKLKDTEKLFNDLNIEFNKLISVKDINEKRKQVIQNELTQLTNQINSNNNSLAEKRSLIKEIESFLIDAENEKNEAEKQKIFSEQKFKQESEKIIEKEKMIQQIEFNTEINKNKILDLEDKIQRLIDDKKTLLDQLENSQEESNLTELENIQEELKVKIELKEKAENKLIGIREDVTKHENILRELESKRLETQHSLNPIQEDLQQTRLDEREAKVLFEQRCSDADKLNFNEDTILNSLNDKKTLLEYEADFENISNRIERMGPVNLAAINELEVIKERQNYIQKQVDDLTQASKTLEDAIHKIDVETRDKLKQTFNEVNENFSEFFTILFNGGKATLELLGQEILDTGIQVMARPPGKKNTTIHLLSGGEKALTAIALVFALFKLNPAPFCLMDEVDAPLDDSNTERYSELVKKMAVNTQFIFVSHNKITMEIAEQLIGVTMQEAGVSRIVEVDLQQIEKMEMVN